MRNKTKNLYRYLKKRSKIEKVKWGLPKSYFEHHYWSGIRNFFGVQIDDNGKLLFDEQEPYDGFFPNNK